MAERFVTPLTPGRPNYGHAVEQIAAAMLRDSPVRRTLMPWQSHVARLQTEVLEDGSWAYSTIIVTVPRQAGKTTLRAPIALHRCILRPMSRCYITAQTRQDARDIVVDDAGPRFVRTPLTRLGALRRSQGSEGIYFASGSFWRVFAPNEDAVHGKATALVDVDEMWAFDAVEGAALEQAIFPTFTTTGGQFSGISTAGHAGSEWMQGYVDLGRDAVTAGRRTGIAYVEHSLTPEDADEVRAGLHDGPDTKGWAHALGIIVANHPAHGYTLKVAAVDNAMRTMYKDPVGGVDGILRAYGNVWTEAAVSVIPAHLWQQLDPAGTHARPALGLGASVDGDDAALVHVWRDDNGAPHARIVDARPGLSWLPDVVDPLRPAAAAIAAGSPVTAVTDTAETAGRLDRVERIPVRDYATACAQTLSLILLGHLRHDHDPRWLDAVRVAARRTTGDMWVWDRRGSAGSVALLEALTVGLWAWDHRPGDLAPPTVHV